MKELIKRVTIIMLSAVWTVTTTLVVAKYNIELDTFMTVYMFSVPIISFLFAINMYNLWCVREKEKQKEKVKIAKFHPYK